MPKTETIEKLAFGENATPFEWYGERAVRVPAKQKEREFYSRVQLVRDAGPDSPNLSPEDANLLKLASYLHKPLDILPDAIVFQRPALVEDATSVKIKMGRSANTAELVDDQGMNPASARLKSTRLRLADGVSGTWSVVGGTHSKGKVNDWARPKEAWAKVFHDLSDESRYAAATVVLRVLRDLGTTLEQNRLAFPSLEMVVSIGEAKQGQIPVDLKLTNTKHVIMPIQLSPDNTDARHTARAREQDDRIAVIRGTTIHALQRIAYETERIRGPISMAERVSENWTGILEGVQGDARPVGRETPEFTEFVAGGNLPKKYRDQYRASPISTAATQEGVRSTREALLRERPSVESTHSDPGPANRQKHQPPKRR